MYKRFEARWMKHADFFLIDILSLQLACVIAYWIRFGIGNMLENEFYRKMVILLAVINSGVAFFDESYSGILRRGYLKEAKACVYHVLWVIGMLLFYLYFTKQNDMMSRIFFAGFIIVSIVIVWTARCLRKQHLKRVLPKSYNIIVLTTADLAADVLHTLTRSDTHVQGLCIYDADCVGSTIAGVPVVAQKDTVLDYIKDHVVDGLFVDLPKQFASPSDILNTCIDMGVSTHVALARTEYGDSAEIIENMGGYTVLTHSVHIASIRQLFLKRAIDICAGLAGVVVTAIVFLFVAPAIYMASPGPIFFSQIRVGKNGRKFKLYKFRSMYLDAEQRKKELMEQNKLSSGLMFKMDDDPRIIKGIGKFIRDYSIDELPQLWNVLKGEMSLVGTRPPTVEEYEQYEYHHKIRLAIKPGITGLWQVSGRSNITDFEQVVRMDSTYIDTWSLALDIKILLKTVKVVLKKDGSA